MTAVSAAGYSSSLTRGEFVGPKRNCYLFLKNASQILQSCLFSGPAFDPLGQARGPAPPLEEKNEDT